jgi:hypothetical protein
LLKHLSSAAINLRLIVIRSLIHSLYVNPHLSSGTVVGSASVVIPASRGCRDPGDDVRWRRRRAE